VRFKDGKSSFFLKMNIATDKMNTTDYTKFEVEDFIQNELFRKWVIDKEIYAENFWNDWMTENPSFVDKIQLAKAFLYALEEKDTTVDNTTLEWITDEVAGQPIRSIPFWQKTVWRVAAGIFFFLALGWWYQVSSHYSVPENQLETEVVFSESNRGFIEKRNGDNSIQKVILADGSAVSLYPQSILRYPKEFLSAKREVYLSGKAFFEVVKNVKQPFWVYTDHISTQVLGTSFLVDALKNKNVSVEVKTGKVSVYTRKDQERAKQNLFKESVGVVLTPNQKVDYSTDEARLLKSIIEKPVALIDLPPTDFIFDEKPVAEAFSLLEKMYGITVIFDNKAMEQCYITANLSNESLFKKLDLICKITHATYEKTDAQIIIHSEGCLK
jgi:CRISPR/Cas system-associated exonuclease Cas4 (RecB family)